MKPASVKGGFLLYLRFDFVLIEPFRKFIQIEKHLIADSNDRHVMFLSPKLNRANVQANFFSEGAQPDEPFAGNLDDFVI
jgi:hypothetical protein